MGVFLFISRIIGRFLLLLYLLFYFLLYYLLLKIGLDLDVARSIFFVCFSSYILAIAPSFRSLHKPLFSYPIFSNSKLNISLLLGILILIGTMTIPGIRNIFGIMPMPLSWLPFIIFWIILNILLVEGAKYLMRKKFFMGKTS